DLALLLEAFRQKHVKIIIGTPPDPSQRPLMLGGAEIRVFGERGRIYAAPNLIYHYVVAHHYKPPDEFLQALRQGRCPPEPEYLDLLERAGLSRTLVQNDSEMRRKA